MKSQDYKNHIRWYVPQHFIFYPLIIALFSLAVYFLFESDDKWPWFFIIILIVVIAWVAYMLRQHYSLTLQDRIIRLEVSYRYFVLTQKRIELLQLTNSQLYALRFAGDEELAILAQKAAIEKLSATTIKRSISNWKADEARV